MRSASFPAPDRRALLVVLGGLHLLAFMSLGPVKLAVEQKKMTFITLVPTPAPAPVKETASRRPSAVRSTATQVQATIQAEEAPTMVLVPAPSEPLPEVAPLENQVHENALGKAGDIDKELREKSFDLRDRKKLAYDKPKFERMMGAAGKPRGAVQVEEIVAPGGRKITRINGKCFYAPHSNNSIMRDPFKSGPPLITQANCPREK